MVPGVVALADVKQLPPPVLAEGIIEKPAPLRLMPV
jgi:hypothetical protein